MFNSPSTRATPRRPASRLREGTSVASRSVRGTHSIFSESRENAAPYPTTPSVRSSRLAISSKIPQGGSGSPTSSAGDTVRTTRVDDVAYERDRDRVYWSKDQRHVVASLGGLPKEVAQLVKSSDLVTSPLAGHVDPKSGFAMVCTPSFCTAWNYLKRTHSSPTTYTFPAPTLYTNTPTTPPVLASLYTGSASSEPGMILISPTGELRFWESMSLALGNVERYQEIVLDLGDEEHVEYLWKVDSNNFIITTSISLAYRLSITSSGGRLVPTITQFTRSGGMFGRTTNNIFNVREDKEGIHSVASAAGYVYLLAQRTIQKWAFGPDAQKFVQEVDLHEAVGSTLFGDAWAGAAIGLQLNDIVPYGNDELAALVSYTEQQPGSSGYPRLHNSHAIVAFAIHPKSQTLVITKAINVSYLAHSDPRMLDVPRLLVPAGSTMAFIRFAEVVVLVSLDEGSPYEEAITLKDTGRNAFIGAGTVPSRKGSVPSIVAIPASGGLMSIEALESSRSGQTLSQQSSATARLKSKMEQAVFFGERSDNPLSFDLPAGFQGDASEAAEAVSAEILTSSSLYMPAIFELRAQLNDRLLRLKELMAFIHHNGLLSILSQASRRRLCRDAEKVRAASDLWDYQNRLMDQIHTRSPSSLLSDAILFYMHQLDVEEEEDFVRLFFRTQVQNLNRLLEVVFATFKAGHVNADRNDLASWVSEANKIFVLVERTAARYREEEVATYEIDREKPVIEIWTAQDSLIDALDFLYSTTEQLIRERTRDLGSVIDEPLSEHSGKEQHLQALLKSQMASLAAALCANMEDKCRATVRRQMDDGADPQEGLDLKEKWTEMKPRVIRPLVGIDRVAEAFALAEHHSDFPTLVALCHEPLTGNQDGNGNGAGRLQIYIERFGEEFAFVLYQWYIDQGQPQAVLNQDEVYGSLVTKFFELNHYPELAWLHHIACKRYGAAAGSLAGVLGDENTKELEQQHLVGSIAKLAAIADVRAKGITEGRKQRLEELDDELEINKIQNDLRESFISTTGQTRRDQSTSLEAQVSLLADRPAFQSLFVNLAQQLVEGVALDIEGLVDVLTLKDNYESGDDAATALGRLVHDETLPEGRKQVALLSIWRRVYIRDDWTDISNTSGRSEQAQRNKLRSTLTYRTIKAINGQKDFPRNFMLSPYTSSQPPLPAEIAARFPSFSAEDVVALMEDHEKEIGLLGKYLEVGLEERVREVAELVGSDRD